MTDNGFPIQKVLALGVVGATGLILFAMRDHLDWSEWGPPVAVFGGAVTGGVGLAFAVKGDDAEAGAIEDAGHREDLLGRRDKALEMLAALETQRDQMSVEDYQAERQSLLAMGARAMQDLEEEAPHPGSAPPPTAAMTGIQELTAAFKAGSIDATTYATAVAALSDSANHAPPAKPSKPVPAAPAAVKRTATAPKADSVAPAWKGAAFAIAGFALFGTLLYAMQTDVADRRDGAPMSGRQDLGDGKTPVAGGDGPQARPPMATQAIQQAEQALAANPNDMDALNNLTRFYLNEPGKAWNYNQKAREVDPKDAAARSYEALITAMMGMPEKAQEKFDSLLAENPDYAPGWAYKGLTLMNTQDFPGAVNALEKAQVLGLNDPTITDALAVARAGGEAPPAAPTPAGSSAILAKGTVQLDPNRSTFKGQVLFVALRPAGMTSGPPIASVKLPPGPYPLDFELTTANVIAMGGGPPPEIPGNLSLSLRLDDDGNAFTKSDSDPQVLVDPIARGTNNLSLTLK